jgi:hypothetical protein
MAKIAELRFNETFDFESLNTADEVEKKESKSIGRRLKKT